MATRSRPIIFLSSRARNLTLQDQRTLDRVLKYLTVTTAVESSESSVILLLCMDYFKIENYTLIFSFPMEEVRLLQSRLYRRLFVQNQLKQS